MPTDLENINTAISQVITRITEVTTSSEPDWMDQGRRVDAGTYLMILTGRLEDLFKAKRQLTSGSGIGIIWLGRKTYEESDYGP